MDDLKYLNATQNFKLNFSKTNFLLKKHKAIPNNLTVTQPEYGGVETRFFMYRKEASLAVLCGVNAPVV